MRVYLYLILSAFIFLSWSCKTPYFPLDNYQRMYAAEVYSGHEVKQVTEGYYQLKIYAVDTIYARKRIKYYTTRPYDMTNAEATKSLYIYFIDDMRFVYSGEKFNVLDVKGDVGGKNDMLGLYMIYAQNRTMNGSPEKEYFVRLAIAESRVSNAVEYTYAVIDLKLSDNNDSLDFLSAEYPLTTKPRKNTSIAPAIPFSKEILEEDLEKMQKSKLLHYNSSAMQFHAQWVFRAEPISTLIDGKPYNRILYQNVQGSQGMTRTYSLDTIQVFQEFIYEDDTQNILLTW